MQLLSLLFKNDFVVPNAGLALQLRQVLINVPEHNLVKKIKI